MVNKFAEKLRKIESAVKEQFDPWAESNLIRSSSPALNWVFGKTHGLPLGYTTLAWGQKKAGKSVVFLDLVGQVHKKWPQALCVKFDTEFRGDGQLTPELEQEYGIDHDRLVTLQTNQASGVFDVINNEIKDVLASGADIKLIGIDSISNILGRKTATQESVNNFQIGDHAQTMQIGLQSIRELIFRNRIHLYLAAHARQEMDRIQIMRGNIQKAAAATAVMHLCEFILNIERNETRQGGKDELENELQDDSKPDMVDAKGAARTGHKIRFWMQGSTFSDADRQGEATFDYRHGFVNQHEEVFKIGKAWDCIERVSNVSWKIGDELFSGKANLLEQLKARPELQKTVIEAIMRREKEQGVTISRKERLAKIANSAPDPEPEEV